ncbi:MAG: Type 1 glutamine amidotransferase-like domain-containing protein [Microthrixaceae bacterium]
MSGTLALIGGAEFGDTHEHHRPLFDPGSTVTLVPTAMAFESPQRVIDDARAHFSGIDVKVEVLPVFTRVDAFDDASIERVRSARQLYVTGGSPMHLRAVLKDAPLLDAMIGAWDTGASVAVAAESATVLCSHMVDNRGGAFTVGLGLITAFTVIAQFDRWSHDKRHRTVGLAPTDLPVVGLDEATALIRSPEGAWSAQGTGSVHVFRGGAEVGLDALPAELN